MSGVVLTTCQDAALADILAWFRTTRRHVSSFYRLRGYAGTGKTFLAGHLVRLLLQENPERKIVVVAPTNKAVDVLRSKMRGLPVTFRTLDSYLGFRIKRNDDWQMEKSRNDPKNDTSPDLLLVDEASMVKAEYEQELRYRRVPVLAMGDPAQLQPVGEELSPLLMGDGPSHTMTTITRQEAGNPIIELASFLRGCVDNNRSFILPDVRSFANKADPRIVFTPMRNVYDWAEGAYRKGLDCRILAFTNATVNNANAIMHQRLYPEAPLYGVGERVLVNEAFEYDSDTLLTNGEVLTVTACAEVPPLTGNVVTYEVQCTREAGVEADGGKMELTLLVALDPNHALQVHRQLTDQIYKARGEGNIELYERLLEERRPLNKLAPLRHIYACTVHKSQGSTYDVAMVDFSDIYRSREMRARLMYVAATRPSKFLVMLHNG